MCERPGALLLACQQAINLVPVGMLDINSSHTVYVRPIPRRGLIFGIVSMALLMASVDANIVATALPAIQHDLHAPVNWAGWTITIYSLGQALIMPVAGRISDQFGRKKVFVGAAVLFTAASLACALANNIVLLVALRAIQSIGGGAFMSSATGIVADNFGRGRDRALGMFTSILPIGGSSGRCSADSSSPTGRGAASSWSTCRSGSC